MFDPTIHYIKQMTPTLWVVVSGIVCFLKFFFPPKPMPVRCLHLQLPHKSLANLSSMSQRPHLSRVFTYQRVIPVPTDIIVRLGPPLALPIALSSRKAHSSPNPLLYWLVLPGTSIFALKRCHLG